MRGYLDLNRRNYVGKIVTESPPGVTMCANGKWSTNPTAPGVCSYNGGWIKNYPELSRTLQAKRKRNPQKFSAGTSLFDQAVEEAPTPIPVQEIEEDVTDGPHYRIDAKRKAELHLGYEFYKSLPIEQQKEIKRYFTWSRQRSAWVSKGRFDNWSAQNIIKALDLPLAGKDERMTFAERMEQQKSNAEYRADRLDRQIDNSKRRQQQLQAEFNERRKDWSWVTQPNVNTSGGRAFSRQREKVLDRYHKGFEEMRRQDELYSRMVSAMTTAQQYKLKDPDYLQRKIKENEKSLQTRTEQIEILEKIAAENSGTMSEEQQATWQRGYENATEGYLEAAEKIAFFDEALERLKEEGVKIFNRENLKGAAYVKARGEWFEVYRVNPTTVTHSWFVGTWKRPHTEIEDVVYSGDDFTVRPLRGGYTYTVERSTSKVNGLNYRGFLRRPSVLNL